MSSAYFTSSSCVGACCRTPDERGRREGTGVQLRGPGDVLYRGRAFQRRREPMLWLILGIVLLAIAIAGGAIVHPVIFALGIVALLMFFMHFRGGGRRAAL